MALDFKNAAAADLRDEYDRIATQTCDARLSARRELNHLPQVLAAGEQVLAFGSGLMDGGSWLIVLTDRRIVFLDEGATCGLEQATIALDEVGAVHGKTGLRFGEIAIDNGGSRRRITQVSKKTVGPFTSRIRDAIDARRQASRAPLEVPIG